MYSSLRSMQHSANASFGPVARESQTCTNTRTCRDGSDSWYKYLCGWVKGPFSVQPLQSGNGATANRQLKFACPIGPVTRSCTSDSCGGASVGCTCAGGGGGRAVQCPSLRKGLAARGGTPSRRRSRTLRLISLCSCPAEPVREPTRRRRGAHIRALSVDAAVSALPQAPAAAKAVRATAQACPAVQASTGSTGSAARPAWAPFHSTLARRVGSRRQSPSTR